jgi:hypothetical protein
MNMPAPSKKIALLIGSALILLWTGANLGQGQNPPLKKPVPGRDSFFGLHFDLHPNDKDVALGEDVSAENIGRLLERVGPDYVQYDCKGHVGWAGYPTKVGWPAPGIKKDSLAVWRKMTRERGVGLYIHYSGVWDGQAIAHHPDWARVKGRAFGSPLARGLYPRASTAKVDPRVKPGTPSAVEARYLASTGRPWDLMA